MKSVVWGLNKSDASMYARSDMRYACMHRKISAAIAVFGDQPGAGMNDELFLDELRP